MKYFFIGASRGRNPTDPIDRTRGSRTIQHLEINKKGLCNSLTTALKDNYVIEIEVGIQMIIPLKRGYSVEVAEEKKNIDPIIDIIGNYSKSNYMATAIVSRYGIAPTVRENHGQVTAIIEEEDKL